MSPDINTGSVTQFLIDAINPMPTSVSGVLTNIVDNQRFFIEQFTGDTIGSVISEQYQSAIHDLSTSNVLKLMAIQDLGVNSVRVGDVSTTNENLLNMAREFEERGMTQLKSLSKGIKFFKARG